MRMVAQRHGHGFGEAGHAQETVEDVLVDAVPRDRLELEPAQQESTAIRVGRAVEQGARRFTSCCSSRCLCHRSHSTRPMSP